MKYGQLTPAMIRTQEAPDGRTFASKTVARRNLTFVLGSVLQVPLVIDLYPTAMEAKPVKTTSSARYLLAQQLSTT